MSRSGDQIIRKEECKEEKKSEKEKESIEGLLPLESSPYVKYSDLEEYKRQGYGTEGHMEPKPGRGGGATDAPTLSGTGLSQGQTAAIDAINRQGIP